MHKLRYLLLAAVASLSFAQSSPQFEVASIKPADPNERRMSIQIAPGGRFIANGVTVRFLIQQAYGIKDFQITGGPSWMGTERYDVSAKPEGDANVTGEQLRPMIQALLADRFKLTLHKETKEMPIYALVVGKNGPKMQESEFQDNGSGPAPGPGGGPGPVKGGGPMMGGGGRGGMMRMGRGQLSATGVPMSTLANALSNQLGRNVVDKTGLTKNYDYKLEFTPERGQEMPLGGGPGGDEAHPVESNGPSIFTAVQEQLGLKLEAQKGPVEILIIDRIEKATEN
jgi:uncharacterized protein (TIGR03435 family)